MRHITVALLINQKALRSYSRPYIIAARNTVCTKQKKSHSSGSKRTDKWLLNLFVTQDSQKWCKFGVIAKIYELFKESIATFQ